MSGIDPSLLREVFDRLATTPPGSPEAVIERATVERMLDRVAGATGETLISLHTVPPKGLTVVSSRDSEQHHTFFHKTVLLSILTASALSFIFTFFIEAPSGSIQPHC